MARYRFTLEYDGSGFVGWQRQINGLSVQQAMEEAWTAKQQEYFRRKEAMKAKDFDDAEDVVKDILNVTQEDARCASRS